MKKKIIVVDDSRTVRQEVQMALEGHFEVIEARDGVDGLVKLDHNQDAALMICNVNMQGMSGLDMIEGLRRDPAYCNLPLVMLTSKGQADLLSRAKKAGAKGWLAKPVKPEVLLAVVKKVLRAHGG